MRVRATVDLEFEINPPDYENCGDDLRAMVEIDIEWGRGELAESAEWKLISVAELPPIEETER